ncbi:acetyl-CoA carboxylase biotin carboxyl carrier protein [Verrucomicrobia bacterium LW23]|nr:acetyl-CoA carboxylase biotin carboxyl carrier protein [Verrucomicrobia bacterium LW23]
MDLKEIKALLELIAKNGLAEFELEKPEFKIRIRRTGTEAVQVVTAPPLLPLAPQPQLSLPQPSAEAAAPAAAPAPSTVPLVSPMVGVFYRSPTPTSAPYVDVGSEVREDTVVCIIEAMKVMNEIKADVRGIVTEVLVENGKPVDFNKPLFQIKPL